MLFGLSKFQVTHKIGNRSGNPDEDYSSNKSRPECAFLAYLGFNSRPEIAGFIGNRLRFLITEWYKSLQAPDRLLRLPEKILQTYCLRFISLGHQCNPSSEFELKTILE